VNIDDVGMLPDTTDATLEVMRHGMAKTGSIMVPTPAFERMVKIIKTNPELDFGIHITLTNEWQESLPWKPLLSKDEVPSLYNENGLMWRDELSLTYHAKAEDVEKEMEKQILTALRSGIKLSHMDAHMGCYYIRQDLFHIALRLANKYRLSIIVPRPFYSWFTKSYVEDLRRQLGKHPDTFYGFYRIEGEVQDPSLALKTYQDYLSGLKPGVHYIFIHVASPITETQQAMITDLSIRVRDYQIWTGDAIRKSAAVKKIRFISYEEFL
jgi:predicted glycoside hydrolase/deacetylase ChbG (UPF0249 family)